MTSHYYSCVLQSPSAACEETPICIKSCSVDVAYNYTKKKNVFRLTTALGTELLLQAEDSEGMAQWIRALQPHSAPPGASSSAASEENDKASPLPSKNTAVSKVTVRSLRSKSLASHSPGSKQKIKPYGTYFSWIMQCRLANTKCL
jgi:hypothetical protein